jgi:hypothetical protein
MAADQETGGNQRLLLLQATDAVSKLCGNEQSANSSNDKNTENRNSSWDKTVTDFPDFKDIITKL